MKFVLASIFLLGGIIFLLLVVTKYTKEEHEKEVQKNLRMKSDWYNYENAFLYRLLSSSFGIAKVLLILSALIFIAVGILILMGS